MYYKFFKKEQSGQLVNKGLSAKQIKKKRVEIKCKKLTGGKNLIIIKDLNLYTELEKNRTKNNLKTLFFASFAHELVTPINIISGLNEEAIY